MNKNNGDKIKNGYLKKWIFVATIASLCGIFAFIYGISANAVDNRIKDQEKDTDKIAIDFKDEKEMQRDFNLKVAESLGRIEQALGIIKKK